MARCPRKVSHQTTSGHKVVPLHPLSNSPAVVTHSTNRGLLAGPVASGVPRVPYGLSEPHYTVQPMDTSLIGDHA